MAHRKAIPLIVSAAVGAAVCGPVPAAAGTAGGAGTVLEWRDCTVDDVAPDPFGGGGEMPEPPDGMRCADLEVPIDYDDPAGATVALQVARVPSTGGGDTGPPVLLAPGGPGGPGIADFAPWTGAADGLLDGADLVTWNPRGTGGETMEMLSPEECLMSGPEFTVPRTEEEYDAAVAANEEAFELCRSAAPELFANMDSATHARDMDAIRAALGEERLRHFGYSYGAVLDVSYARLFPQRVEAMFLDSAVSHVGDFEIEESAFYRMMEEAFAEFAEWCAGADECVWQGEDVSAEWRALTAAAEEEPIPAGDGDLLLDGDDLRTAAAPMAKNAELWPVFSEAAGNALDGDASGFLNGPGGGRPYFSSSSQATECADGVRFGDYQGYRAALERGDELSPNFGGNQAGYDLACTGWPVPEANPRGPIDADGLPPMLLASSANEFFDAEEVAEQVPGSVAVQLEGIDHNLYLELGNGCVIGHADRYLLDGVLPEQGTTCELDA
ncbi:alpha/beta hydrolase [Nocardiopsis composta]|uniref:Pimeloyl-ACP methyl ester carboxylesterase n=1 Tax=Nocardiopsis composta TaxID=157465 RepID=A0A7W8VEX5_9ACTN|nr:alpha/beta fold hydrolase [Nocardiopsis composta]MBB5433797.1 pimeloyl-ACP methyl ester carboxylesterase [Nocardiopsis composta]